MLILCIFSRPPTRRVAFNLPGFWVWNVCVCNVRNDDIYLRAYIFGMFGADGAHTHGTIAQIVIEQFAVTAAAAAPSPPK